MRQACVRKSAGCEPTQDAAAARTKRACGKHVIGHEPRWLAVSEENDSFASHERIEKKYDRVCERAIGVQMRVERTRHSGAGGGERLNELYQGILP